AGTSTKNIVNRLTSIKKVGAGPSQTTTLFIIDHGINERTDSLVAQGLSVADYKANLVTLVEDFLTSGHLVLLVELMPPDESVWPCTSAPSTTQDYIEAMREVGATYGVPVINMGLWDWVAKE